MDKAGNIVSLHPEFVFEHIKMDVSGRIVGTTANSITLLSLDYQQIANIVIAGEEIKDFAVKDDTVAILTASDKVMLYVNDLSLLTEFALEGEEEYKFIAVGNGRIALAGDEVYGDIASNNYATTSFLKEYTTDGFTPMFSDDIGVVGMDLGSSVNIQQVGISSVLYRVSFPDANIMVHNFGENPVSQFYLRSPEVGKAVDNLNILPGEDLNVPWPDLYFYSNEYPAGLTYDVCAWTSHPNLSFDADASNDTYCTGFLVKDEEVVEQNNISIYPNPASDVVNFQMKTQQPLTHAAFRIVGTDGRVMEEVASSDNDTSFVLPVSNWAPGIYFLQFLEDGAVKGSTRFVVVR